MNEKAETSTYRTPSIIDAETYNEKNLTRNSSGEGYIFKTPEALENVDEIERVKLLIDEEEAIPVSTSAPLPAFIRAALLWMVVNTLATIGIVSLVSCSYRN